MRHGNPDSRTCACPKAGQRSRKIVRRGASSSANRRNRTAGSRRYSLALAGGYAVSAHGIGNRPSGDVDLFTDWQCRADFPAAADLVIAALQEHGYRVAVDKRNDTFARLLVSTDAADGAEKVELAADWRSHPPVTLDIGPVLHPDDAVANKMAALYGRALPRDFLDIDTVLQSGRYTREDLLRLAEAADAGFDRGMFAQVLGALTQITDAALAPYGTTTDEALAIRKRFADWRMRLSGEATDSQPEPEPST